MDTKNIMARLEGIANFLEGMVGDFDFDAEAEEKRLTEARGEEYTPWYCPSCYTDAGLFEDARAQLTEVRRLINALVEEELDA